MTINQKKKKEAIEKERSKIKSLQKPIDYWQFSRLSFIDKKNYIKEWFCKCKHCGEKWHYLDDVEKKMRSQNSTNCCLQAGSCPTGCAPFFITSAVTSNSQTQLKRQIGELKQCPKCKSSNVTCEAKYFKKE